MKWVSASTLQVEKAAVEPSTSNSSLASFSVSTHCSSAGSLIGGRDLGVQIDKFHCKVCNYFCQCLVDKIIYCDHVVGWVYTMHGHALNRSSNCNELIQHQRKLLSSPFFLRLYACAESFPDHRPGKYVCRFEHLFRIIYRAQEFYNLDGSSPSRPCNK